MDIIKPTCATCRYFSALKPGWAAICHQRWRGLPWNAAVPLTSADNWCSEYQFNSEKFEPDGTRRVDGQVAGVKP